MVHTPICLNERALVRLAARNIHSKLEDCLKGGENLLEDDAITVIEAYIKFTGDIDPNPEVIERLMKEAIFQADAAAMLMDVLEGRSAMLPRLRWNPLSGVSSADPTYVPFECGDELKARVLAAVSVESGLSRIECA